MPINWDALRDLGYSEETISGAQTDVAEGLSNNNYVDAADISAQDVVEGFAEHGTGTTQTLAQGAVASGNYTPSGINPNYQYPETYTPPSGVSFVGSPTAATITRGMQPLTYTEGGTTKTLTLDQAGKTMEGITQTKAGEPVSAGVLPEEVSIQDALNARSAAQAALDQYGTQAFSRPEFEQAMNTLLAAEYSNATKQNPPKPVLDLTPEQNDVVTGDTELQKFVKDIATSMGKDKLQEQRIDLLNQMAAVQKAYGQVIDQIKDNPNLPKGLAARRLTEVFEDQKFAVNSILSQLDVIDQQLDDIDDEIDRQLGIYEYEQTRADKELERKQQQWQYMVDSGAVAGLTDAELARWAQLTGMPVEAMKAVKSASLEGTADYDLTYDVDETTGVRYAIYTDKNNPTAPPITVPIAKFDKVSFGKVSTGEKLDFNDVMKYGLPSSFVGASAMEGARFLEDIKSETPPDWYLQALEEQLQMSIARPEDREGKLPMSLASPYDPFVQEAWDDYRTQFGPENKNNETSLDELATLLAGG
jgi:acyl transferase domain-containing protein